jgi:L-alanine-DL-glutamate epimerase-like enolase superfamily enzyme
MLQLRSFVSDLPFEYPFTIAHGTKTHQRSLVVSLSFGKLTGLGEAPQISYYPETIESMQQSLAKHAGVISRYSLTDPARFWHFLHHLIPGEHFLTAALDCASWDLFAKLRRQPLYAALGLSYTGSVETDYTIGLDSAEVMGRKLLAHPAAIYKVKLAKPDDIDTLRYLRTLTTAPFRVDVNEGWSYNETLALLPELNALDVRILEQPLAKDAREEMVALKAQSPIPLFADESCRLESDVAHCRSSFHGIVVKLAKCGGLTPGLRMLREAKSLGLQTMISSMNECTIGTAAMVHLSAAADFLDADGPLLLKADQAGGLEFTADGRVGITEAPGSGISLLPA